MQSCLGVSYTACYNIIDMHISDCSVHLAEIFYTPSMLAFRRSKGKTLVPPEFKFDFDLDEVIRAARVAPTWLLRSPLPASCRGMMLQDRHAIE